MNGEFEFDTHVPMFQRVMLLQSDFKVPLKDLAPEYSNPFRKLCIATTWLRIMMSTAPANRIYRYEQRVKWIAASLPPFNIVNNQYQAGDNVWVKVPHRRCTSKFGKGQVDGIVRHPTKQYWLIERRTMWNSCGHGTNLLFQKTAEVVCHLRVTPRLHCS